MSVSTRDDIVMYYMTIPDGRTLAICADITSFDTNFAVIYYTITLDDDLLEEAVVDTSKKPIDPIARDIIDLMRMCSIKIMIQEAHLTHSKYMIHQVTNKKTYS